MAVPYNQMRSGSDYMGLDTINEDNIKQEMIEYVQSFEFE